jgi:PAS domain S-box-containing protein
MWVVDQESLAFLAVNDAATDHHGFRLEQLLAMQAGDLVSGEAGTPLRERLAAAGWGGQVPGGQPGGLRLRRKDGSVAEIDLSSTPIGFGGRPAFLVLVTDVTETRRLETQLRQAQKMEAVGQLAGGIAHDFNNLLGVILAQGEMIRRSLPEGHPSRARVAEVAEAAERAAGLTRQLLAFGRRQVLSPDVLDLNELVSGVERMLRRLLPETIEIVVSLQPGLGRVRADRGQFEQVLLNLSLNARDAMATGGRLVVTTADVELDEPQARVRPDLAPGQYVALGIEDTGSGMDAATLSRVFEPFFTTKPEGRGTGLGLAMVYGIVKQSGGHVVAYSEPGHGTAFRIYLPRVDQRLSPATRAEGGTARGGAETVLVVEDQPALRQLVAEILGAAGYRVLAEASAEEARARARAEPGQIQLVVTDVVLPRQDGPALVRELRGDRPGLRAILMSGYAPHTTEALERLGRGVRYLQKPFTMDALLRAAREILDSGPDHTPGATPAARS